METAYLGYLKMVRDEREIKGSPRDGASPVLHATILCGKEFPDLKRLKFAGEADSSLVQEYPNRRYLVVVICPVTKLSG
jgi:hypothetical protein